MIFLLLVTVLVQASILFPADGSSAKPTIQVPSDVKVIYNSDYVFAYKKAAGVFWYAQLSSPTPSRPPNPFSRAAVRSPEAVLPSPRSHVDLLGTMVDGARGFIVIDSNTIKTKPYFLGTASEVIITVLNGKGTTQHRLPVSALKFAPIIYFVGAEGIAEGSIADLSGFDYCEYRFEDAPRPDDASLDSFESPDGNTVRACFFASSESVGGVTTKGRAGARCFEDDE